MPQGCSWACANGMLPVGRWWQQGMPGDAAYKVDAMASTQAVKSLHHDKECPWELYPRSCWRHDTGTLSPLLPLMRESTSNQCIPLKRPYGTSKAEIWCFLRCHPEQSLPFWQKYRVAGHSKRQDANVMLLAFCICGENAGEAAPLNAGSLIRNIGVFVALLDNSSIGELPTHQGAFLLSWTNSNPGMHKWLHSL